MDGLSTQRIELNFYFSFSFHVYSIRSTPRQDEFWGGANDLTATAGFEESGVTTLIFRRKLNSTDVTDHSIVDDLMHVIWARGEILSFACCRKLHVDETISETNKKHHLLRF